jgi:hypothetical protein
MKCVILQLFAELRARIFFFCFSSVLTTTAIVSSFLVRSPQKQAHPLSNGNAQGAPTFYFPDAITIALLGKYQSFFTERLA